MRGFNSHTALEACEGREEVIGRQILNLHLSKGKRDEIRRIET